MAAVPSLSVASDLPASADVLVVFAAPDGDGGPRAFGIAPGPLESIVTPDLLARAGVAGAADSLVRIPLPEGAPARTLAVAGVGGRLDGSALRRAAGAAVRQLAGTREVALLAPDDTASTTAALLEGAALGAYAFSAFRGVTAAKQKAPVERVVVHGGSEGEGAVARAGALAEAVATVKTLVNTPAADLYPESFAAEAGRLAAELPVEVRVWDEEALARDGFGGILGVGRGSARPPRLVRLRYEPAGARRHVALVGKGITFDSGGLSLKPPASMIGMKYDMTGAATVLGVLLAAARLQLPVRVTAWLCLAENMPSGTATRPGDVLTIRGGTTVEVLNTDAEGRLVLADGLVAASEEAPDEIIDVATLTGAASVALGKRTVGVMGDDDLVARLREAGSDSGELLWPMPLTEELRPLLDSPIADIANVKPGNTAAGMLVAAVFLRDFVGTKEAGDGSRAPIPWAHLDVAGPANNDGPAWGFTGVGSTGVTVRSLVRHLERTAG